MISQIHIIDFYSEHHDSIGESDDVGASQEDGDGDATQMRTYRGMKCIHYSAKLFSYLFTFLLIFFLL